MSSCDIDDEIKPIKIANPEGPIKMFSSGISKQNVEIWPYNPR